MPEDEKDQTEEKADKIREKIQGYGDIMVDCLNQAARVLELAELCPEQWEGPFLRERIGTALYETITRRSQVLDVATALAFEYGKQFLSNIGAKVKPPEAVEREDCEHPGLKMLNNLWSAGEDQPSHVAAKHAIGALAIKEIPPYGGDVLLCPHCRELFAVEVVKSGALWE